MPSTTGEAGPPIVIASTSQENMVMEWEVLLCLHRRVDGSWKIDLRRWELIWDDVSEWDEDTEERILPEQVDGVDVIGQQEGYLVLANPVPLEYDARNYVFTDFGWDEFNKIFEDGWSDEVIWRKIEVAIGLYPKVG